MDDKNIMEKAFIIDLSNAQDTLQIINELSDILEMTESKHKSICLKLRNVELSQSQLLSIRALIDASGSSLAFIDTDTERTILSANELNIPISTITENLQVSENENSENIENISTENQEQNYQEESVENSTVNETSEENIQQDNQQSENSEQEYKNEEPVQIQEDIVPETELFKEQQSEEQNYNQEETAYENNEPSETPQEVEEHEENTNNETILNNEFKFPDFENLSQRITETEKPNTQEFDKLFTTTTEVQKETSYEIFKTEEIEAPQSNKELPTLYLKQTLRSGQTLCYDGNILVIGDTHPGSELIAKGDITVWGVLGGIAHAGTCGDKNAKIRALKLNGIQLRIAGIYAGRLNTENIPYIQRSNEFTPQEACLENDILVIKNINNNLTNEI